MALVIAYVVLSDLPAVPNVAQLGGTKLMNLVGESLGKRSSITAQSSREHRKLRTALATEVN